jgi:membrane fusion protein, multidrug efflux system
MAEPSLKVVTDAPPADATQTDSGKAFEAKASRGRLRMILLILVPLIAAIIGGVIYLGTGRYISTDNAYVGLRKVLITPDISGKIDRVLVREGQHVKAGDELFEIDPAPFSIARAQAQAKLSSVRTDFTNLKSDLKSYTELSRLAEENAQLKRLDVDRKKTLVTNRTGSEVDYENAVSTQVTAELQAKLAARSKDQAFNQLLGNPDLPIEQFPAYQQAKAALDQAQRDLDHTMLRAPIEGTATQVDNIQLGRFVTAGMPVFSVVDDTAPWVDANPKETDITNLRIGQRATVEVDTFPDHTFTGTVVAVSPGTGSQFAILPAQNASGNWVKVVQRVPVRIQLDRDPENSQLRAGMSANVEIDTGKEHAWFGAVAKEAPRGKS